MTPAARERHRKRLLEMKAEILAEGDLEIEPGGRTRPRSAATRTRSR